MLRDYLTLWASGADARRLLVFGLLLTVCSSFGQTFFIGMFGEDIRATFSLTDASYGALYSLATIASGATIMFVGHWVDHLPLRWMTVGVVVGLAVAGAVMATAPVAAMLVVGIFLLRFTGQGLMGHVAMTTIAREFTRQRGTALAVVALGYAIGEAVLPPAVEFLGSVASWRQLWAGMAGVVFFIVLPASIWLTREHAADVPEDDDGPSAPPDESQRSWTRWQVLGDWRFYMVLPTVLGPAFIATGFFFHQDRLIEEKAWDASFFALCFVAFALTQVPSSIVSGPMIDRFKATRLLPLAMLPLAAGLTVLAAVDHRVGAIGFMACLGVTSGAVGTVFSAMWVELYGTRHLGAIRALATALMVFSTGASPVLMGVLIGRGVTLRAIAIGCIVWCLTASIMAIAARRAA